MTRSVLLLIALALAGCSTRPPLAQAAGPWRALNPGRWEPTAADLRNVRIPRSPAQSAALKSHEDRE